MRLFVFVIFYIIRVIRMWFPQKYPAPGTRVRVRSYTHRYTHRAENNIDESMYDGTVVGPEYRYTGPFEQQNGFAVEGKYLFGDPRWEQMWVVKLDDKEGTLEQHDLPDRELVSGYRWGVPILHWLVTPTMWFLVWRRMRKVSELPHTIEFYRGDFVIHADDQTRSARKVTRFRFELDGTLTYSVEEIEEEWKALQAEREAEGKRSGKAYSVVMGPGVKYEKAEGNKLTLVRRGNYYYLANGEPSDLSFLHVTLEVEFWQRVGLWRDDHEGGKWPEITIDEAREKLLRGEIDTVHTGAIVYSPIVLPERFAKFRERSRAASIAYLDSFAGKYSFNVLPRKSKDSSVVDR